MTAPVVTPLVDVTGLTLADLEHLHPAVAAALLAVQQDDGEPAAMFQNYV